MKKLLLCMIVLSGMTFFSCSDDSQDATNTTSCVTCTITLLGATSTQEVCNRNGTAVIDGTEVGDYQGWINSLTEQGYSCQ